MPTLSKSNIRCSGRRRSAAMRRAATAGKRETLRTIAHDARNVVTALELCCDLLAEPGVLAEGQETFAGELRMVASTGAALIGQLARLAASDASREMAPVVSAPIDDLAEAVRRLERTLAALAGPQIHFEMECLSCCGGVRLSHEDLTRVLVNLTRNAAEAMPQGDGGSFFDAAIPARTVLLCVQDSGPGIPRNLIGRIFDAGFTTKKRNGANRGLGLSIVRRLTEAAGGTCVQPRFRAEERVLRWSYL